ncbi:MAG: 3-keto-5-aminohexanoate cleavage protein, partial [Pseudomonadota bacterium]
MSDNKVIITIAPTGGMANKQMNPHLPTQPQEIADDVARCADAGASVVAVHARREDDTATCDPEIYRDINTRIREKCDVVINNSTGGGVTGEMVRETENGDLELSWEQRIKGVDGGAEICTHDAHTIVANFNNKSLLVKTTTSQSRQLAIMMKERG